MKRPWASVRAATSRRLHHHHQRTSKAATSTPRREELAPSGRSTRPLDAEPPAPRPSHHSVERRHRDQDRPRRRPASRGTSALASAAPMRWASVASAGPTAMRSAPRLWAKASVTTPGPAPRVEVDDGGAQGLDHGGRAPSAPALESAPRSRTRRWNLGELERATVGHVPPRARGEAVALRRLACVRARRCPSPTGRASRRAGRRVAYKTGRRAARSTMPEPRRPSAPTRDVPANRPCCPSRAARLLTKSCEVPPRRSARGYAPSPRAGLHMGHRVGQVRVLEL